MAYNEADTRAKIIDPKLYQSGWVEDFISREFYFTEGKIYLVGDEAKRKDPKKAGSGVSPIFLLKLLMSKAGSMCLGING